MYMYSSVQLSSAPFDVHDGCLHIMHHACTHLMTNSTNKKPFNLQSNSFLLILSHSSTFFCDIFSWLVSISDASLLCAVFSCSIQLPNAFRIRFFSYKCLSSAKMSLILICIFFFVYEWVSPQIKRNVVIAKCAWHWLRFIHPSGHWLIDYEQRSFALQANQMIRFGKRKVWYT